MECNNLNKLISNKKFDEIPKNFSSSELVLHLSFEKALVLSYYLLHTWDSDIQTYAINLIEEIKKTHPKKWESLWNHEAYLGYAYQLQGWDFDKQFDAYQRALDKSNKPVPEVLMRLAITWSSPGVYQERMDEKRAIAILEHIIKETPYKEAVGSLMRLYERTNQFNKAQKLEHILAESEKNDVHDKFTYLEFLNDYENSM